MQSSLAVKAEQQFSLMTCGGCNIHYYVPEQWKEARLSDGEGFSCPNGCRRQFGENDKTRLEKAEQELMFARSRLEDEQRRHFDTKRELKAKKEGLRKIRHRIFHGVCPCCRRHFDDLQSHMASKHPDYVDDRSENTRKRDEQDAKILDAMGTEWEQAKAIGERAGKSASALAPMLGRMAMEGLVERRYRGCEVLWRKAL